MTYTADQIATATFLLLLAFTIGYGIGYGTTKKDL